MDADVDVTEEPVADRLEAVPDHVAVAVPDFDDADARWRDQLGGRWSSWSHDGVFRARQYRFRGGAKLELIQPSERDPAPDNFVRRFLDRFGATVHHVTLKVDDLFAAIEVLGAHGYDVVDVHAQDPRWQEGFLRPSQVGGMIVQVAHSGLSDRDWRDLHPGFTPEDPPADGAVLLGPVLRHPDLDTVRRLWTVLGAEVADGDGELVCSWGDAPLRVFVRPGEPAGPDHLRMADAPDLPQNAALGAPVRAT